MSRASLALQPHVTADIASCSLGQVQRRFFSLKRGPISFALASSPHGSFLYVVTARHPLPTRGAGTAGYALFERRGVSNDDHNGVASPARIMSVRTRTSLAPSSTKGQGCRTGAHQRPDR